MNSKGFLSISVFALSARHGAFPSLESADSRSLEREPRLSQPWRVVHVARVSRLC